MSRTHNIASPLVPLGAKNDVSLNYLISGRCNDQGVANSIGLVGLLAQHFAFNDATFSLLADGGYRAEDQIIIPYR